MWLPRCLGGRFWRYFPHVTRAWAPKSSIFALFFVCRWCRRFYQNRGVGIVSFVENTRIFSGLMVNIWTCLIYFCNSWLGMKTERCQCHILIHFSLSNCIGADNTRIRIRIRKKNLCQKLYADRAELDRRWISIVEQYVHSKEPKANSTK